MKKVILSLVCAASVLCAAGFEDGRGERGGFGPGERGERGEKFGPRYGGGFDGPSRPVRLVSVEKAKKSWDDTKVVLQGRLVRKVGHEKYIFADNTGEVVADIDDKRFRGVTVTPQNVIEIYGEVDKDMFEETEIDVKFLKVLK